ncbi:hypothetical protein [Treponema denticola]|uniref:hypothetical protein n=1 Tax=Treponema denticola TaxID=158 RepID=UPI0003529734|nr:hypothetical protein [Treponema denticola]EPF37713.1 hypothetical protein HMPREF9732_00306 [Treponema denticola SP32]
MKNENSKYIIKIIPHGRLDLQGFYTGLTETEEGTIASTTQDAESPQVKIFDGLQAATEEYIYILANNAVNTTRNDVCFLKKIIKE